MNPRVRESRLKRDREKEGATKGRNKKKLDLRSGYAEENGGRWFRGGQRRKGSWR